MSLFSVDDVVLLTTWAGRREHQIMRGGARGLAVATTNDEQRLRISSFEIFCSETTVFIGQIAYEYVSCDHLRTLIKFSYDMLLLLLSFDIIMSNNNPSMLDQTPNALASRLGKRSQIASP